MDFSTFTSIDKQDVFIKLDTTETGLSEVEAEKRQFKYGLNIIKTEEVGWLKLLARQFRSSFIYLLLAAAIISFLLGEQIDALMVIIFVVINTALGFYQEFRSEQTMKLLKKFTIHQVKVRREDKEILINSQELVPGDIVIVETGDIIPADIRFVKGHDLTIDESVLTGESAPVSKVITALSQTSADIYKAENIGFSQTAIASGRAEGVVLATGRQTVVGDVSRLVVETVRESGFEKGINSFSRFVLKTVLATLPLVFLANLFIKGEKTDVIQLVIFSIALAVSVIPEALPVVITFSLSRGALRLAKNKVVIRRLSAIEDLGSIEILCSDKTGTLTENELKVADIQTNDSKNLFQFACLASSFLNDTKKQPNNAFDLALLKRLSADQKKELEKYKRENEIPFDPERRRNSVIVSKDGRLELIVRGAAEAILDYCSNLDSDERKKLENWLAKEGKNGRRIIAIASKPLTNFDKYTIKDEENNLTFLGLISFSDPLKKTAFQAIAKAKQLGVQVKILTGDSKEVAGAVAYKVGLVDSIDKVITGSDLAKLPANKWSQVVAKYSVFARVSPQQKYKIIETLKKRYEVGFLGEGINDAPALRIANVAIVVHDAADIARETADIVLLKKDLEVIVNAIVEGREVFSNTIKYIKATLASNFGNFYAIAISSLFISFLPMLPLQILLVNLLSDFPMISVATDNVDPSELRRPKSYNVREVATFSTVFGLISTVFDFIFFAMFYRLGPQILQTNWFIGSILTELVLLFSIRTKLVFFKSRSPSVVLIALSAVAFAVTIVLPFTSFGRDLFKFTEPNIGHLLIILFIVLLYFVATEAAKIFFYRYSKMT